MEQTTILDLAQVEREVRSVLASGDTERLRQLLAIQHSADVADIIDRLDAGEQCRVFELFTVEQAADVLHESGTETTRQLLDCLSVEEIGDVLDEMPMDEVARVLTRDVPERQEELLAAMEPPMPRRYGICSNTRLRALAG